MMRTYRGIVCEKNKNDMIFLTHDGQFLRGIPLVKDAEVGDEVAFHIATLPCTMKRKPYFIIGPALIAAVLLLFLAGSLWPQPTSVYAYVHLDGEKSIELGVDEYGTIVSVRPLQKEASIDVENWKGQPLEVVLSKAVEEASPTNGKVSISASYENRNQKELNEKIEKVMKEAQNKQSQKPSNTEENKFEDSTEDYSNTPSIQNNKEIDKQHPVVEQKKEEKQLEKSSNNPSIEKESTTNQTKKTNESQDKPRSIPAEKSPAENEKSNKNNKNDSNRKIEEDKVRGNSQVPVNKDENSNSIK